MTTITTLEAFRAWLESLPQNERMFHRCESRRCPLGQYVQDTVGITHYRSDEVRVRLPEWARAFVRRFDGNGSLSGDATPAEALEILRGITP